MPSIRLPVYPFNPKPFKLRGHLNPKAVLAIRWGFDIRVSCCKKGMSLWGSIRLHSTFCLLRSVTPCKPQANATAHNVQAFSATEADLHDCG